VFAASRVRPARLLEKYFHAELLASHSARADRAMQCHRAATPALSVSFRACLP